MHGFINTLLRISSSTESKLKNATNNQQLGPYNHELIELSELTFQNKQLAIITDVFEKKLRKYANGKQDNHRRNSDNSKNSENDIFINENDQDSHRNSRKQGDISKQRRSSTDKNNEQTEGNISPRKMRPSDENNHSNNHPNNHSNNRHGRESARDSKSSHESIHNENVIDEKTSLVLLKIITVMLYLLQNGSQHFVSWMLDNYSYYIRPLSTAQIHSRYGESLKFKVGKIITLCESPKDLKEFRINLHRLRSDLSPARPSATLSDDTRARGSFDGSGRGSFDGFRKGSDVFGRTGSIDSQSMGSQRIDAWQRDLSRRKTTGSLNYSSNGNVSRLKSIGNDNSSSSSSSPPSPPSNTATNLTTLKEEDSSSIASNYTWKHQIKSSATTLGCTIPTKPPTPLKFVNNPFYNNISS